MEIALGIGYLLTTLGGVIIAYVIIKLFPFLLSLGLTFAAFQLVFTSLAIPPLTTTLWTWYYEFAANFFFAAAIVAMVRDVIIFPERIKQIKDDFDLN